MPSDSIAFDRAASYYDQTRGFPADVQHTIAALIAKAGSFNKQSHLLEIGVGTGRIALPLSLHVGSIVGIDLARPMMWRLRDKQTHEAIHLVQADATQLPFAAESFDGAVAVHVFHLMANWQQALKEITRVLRPDAPLAHARNRSEEHTSELQSRLHLVCR